MANEEYEDDEELSPEEEEEIKEILKSYSSPASEKNYTIHTFLNKVANSKDTTKTGNLTKDEVGFVRLPLRSLKEYSLIADNLCEDDIMSEHFEKEAEIITATSLSKDAKLINLAVVQKRTFEETARMGQRNVSSNRGWFGRRKPEQPTSEI